ncbi:hypothetical protein [Clostridium tagluense]|uniref:hypothetical protein n=1 Tax=Clostridium tagluense TaxID=360422 RepID=UPI001C6E09B8|nr:hypothetical protein [Clostridium tagluense]MBW9159466.1 hypothetical protein [Clostridium tagluense]WLC68474.1 hypothetical protein KTC93_25510 [Clostridium tagluense]
MDMLTDRVEGNVDDRIFITELLENLSKKQKYIIIEKFYKCHSDVEIARGLNITRQAVNKSKNEALKILKEHIINSIIV